MSLTRRENNTSCLATLLLWSSLSVTTSHTNTCSTGQPWETGGQTLNPDLHSFDSRWHRTKDIYPRVYIYDLPTKFNYEIQDCISPIPKYYTCFRLENGGFGELMYTEHDMGLYNTHHFSLEVILHNQLLHSKYVTTNAAEADVFYIPAYLGILSSCKKWRYKTDQRREELYQFIKTLPYFDQGKLHVSALAKIEREMTIGSTVLLTDPRSRNITFAVIEKEYSMKLRQSYGTANHSIIAVPYPSYVHRFPSESPSISAPGIKERPIMLFIGANVRTNSFRRKLLQEFVNKTYLSYYEYLAQNKNQIPQQVHLGIEECNYMQVNMTVAWMQHAVFCAHPPGDSPTRKAFYDSIQSGCIPVIFKFENITVAYPFERTLDYKEFTVTIPAEIIIDSTNTLFALLDAITLEERQRLHMGVLRVARRLQYSVINSNFHNKADDAVDMLMNEVKNLL